MSRRASAPALGPTQLPVKWVKEALSPGVRVLGARLPIHCHLVSRLRMSRAVKPLFQCLDCMHKENFIFAFIRGDELKST